MVVATGIVVDAPTAAGCIYPRKVVEDAIERFNKKARASKIFGGILDRDHIQRVNEEMLVTREMFINESGVVCARIDILGNASGNKLKEMIADGAVARPIMVIPSYIQTKKEEVGHDPFVVSEIYDITRVQLECKKHE